MFVMWLHFEFCIFLLFNLINQVRIVMPQKSRIFFPKNINKGEKINALERLTFDLGLRTLSASHKERNVAQTNKRFLSITHMQAT